MGVRDDLSRMMLEAGYSLASSRDLSTTDEFAAKVSGIGRAHFILRHDGDTTWGTLTINLDEQSDFERALGELAARVERNDRFSIPIAANKVPALTLAWYSPNDSAGADLRSVLDLVEDLR